MSRYNSSYGGGSSYGTQSYVQQSPQKNNSQQIPNKSSVISGKLTCDIHPTQSVKAICLKESCEQKSRLVCFQCMTSTHTEDSKYFVSVKEIKKLGKNEDVFKVYNYPTELLEEQQYDWIRNYDQKLQDYEQEIEKFYEDYKTEIVNKIEQQKNECLVKLSLKKEAVESSVSELKKSVNTTFSLEPLKNLISDVGTGTIQPDKFKDEVTQFLADDKKGKVRSSIQGEVEQMINLYNFGYMDPSLEKVQGIRDQLFGLQDHLQATLLSPLNFQWISGQPSSGTDSRIIFNNPEAKNPVEFVYNVPNQPRLEQGNVVKTRLRIQDLNEDSSNFKVFLGVHSKQDGKGMEDTGNYIVLQQEISVKHNGEHDAKKWTNLAKKFKSGVLLEVEYNLKKSIFTIWEIVENHNPIQIFKSNSQYFETDLSDWTLHLFSQPQNKFSLEILESSLFK